VSELNPESVVDKPHPRTESLSTQLLDEFQEVAQNAGASIKSTLSSVRESHDQRLEALEVVAGAAALLVLTEGKGVGKLARAVLKGEAVDAKMLELPSVFEKAGQSAERESFTKSLKGTAAHAHIDFETPLDASPVPTKGFSERMNRDFATAIRDAHMDSTRADASLANVDFTLGGVRTRSPLEQIQEALNVDRP
jgi:hypothetical protein